MNYDQDRRGRQIKTTANCAESGQNDLRFGEAEAVLADAAEEKEETRMRRAGQFSDPVCVNSNQIYDSCRDRDCVADRRVYMTQEGQELLETAINVKLKSAEIIWVFTDVEPLSFQRGYFSVDLKFFVCVTLEVFGGVSNPTVVQGLTTYDKRIILYGSEGSSKLFSSKFQQNGSIAESWQKTAMPTVTVEVVDPVALSAKIVDDGECCCEDTSSGGSTETNGRNAVRAVIPEGIGSCLDGDIVVKDCGRKVLVTYGLFYMVRLERDTQLLIDAVDFCIPTQECPSATEGSPCDLFDDIRFPIDEFFPPQKQNYGTGTSSCGCKRC